MGLFCIWCLGFGASLFLLLPDISVVFDHPRIHHEDHILRDVCGVVGNPLQTARTR